MAGISGDPSARVFTKQQSEWNGEEKDATRRGFGTASTKLNQAVDWFRRKVDKIPTPILRGAVSPHADGSGYHSEDNISGERFFLVVNEVKRELERRDGVALKLAEEIFVAYADSANWKGINGDHLKPFSELPEAIQRHWKAAAECMIEKYRCLL